MKAIVYLLAAAALWGGEARYARLGEFQGKVEVQLGPADAWFPAVRNLPLPEGAWLRTGATARVEVECDDGVVWRLGPDAQGEISDLRRLSTGQAMTLFSVDHGVAYLTGSARGNDVIVLAVPGAQVTVKQPAAVRVDAGESSSQIWMLSGAALFSSPAAELQLPQGQTTRVEPATPARFFLDRAVSATELDRWSRDRDRALAKPLSALHVVERYGLADLDAGGEWVHTDELGTVWKPKVDGGWAPFQKGYWRWYGALGYTWVAAETWGWLPYHYGRWEHSKDLGWLWAPNVAQVFKPGDVYWMQGPELAAWGPLTPGERFTPAPDTVPGQFYDAYTTFAPFTPGAATIDPTQLSERPKEALKAAAFVIALPSPPFDAATLDATRPVSRAGSTRILPILPGVTYQSDDQPPIIKEPAPKRPAPVHTAARPPIVIITQPQQTETIEVPVAVPVPYPVVVNGGAAAHRNAKPWASEQERSIYERVLADDDDAGRQLRDLDEWRRKFPRTQHEGVRVYYYLRAYSRLAPPDPAKILETAAGVLNANVPSLFENDEAGRAQALTVLYLTCTAVTALPKYSAPQLRIAQTAAAQLLHYIPTFYATKYRPSAVSEALWDQARAEMQAAAKKILALDQ
jgi:hypothetical protein